MAKLRQLALITLLLVANAAAALEYSGLYVFGDSLSDVGNVDNSPLVPYPIPPYFDGRFSNGRVYSELLSDELDLGLLLPSTEGGNNYAYGSAKTDGSPFLIRLVVDDLRDQVSDYISSHSADPDALYVVWAGANDLFGGQTNVGIPIANIASDLTRLYNAGAREFLVPNLPLLGLTPEHSNNAAVMNARTSAFNSSLESELLNLESQFPSATFHRLDAAGLFTGLVGSPGLFGFTNTTQPAAPGLEGDDRSYSGSVVSNPDQHIFWDNVHPTRAVHELLSQAALRAVSRPGDFNFDGAVNDADFAVWLDAYGSSDLSLDHNGDLVVDSIEYAIWRENLDAGTGSNAAPEPAALLLLAVMTAAATRRLWPRPL